LHLNLKMFIVCYLSIYNYFMKFYRVTKIKPFIEIRKYKTSPRYSVEHKIYSDFMID